MRATIPLALLAEAYSLNSNKAAMVVIRDTHFDITFEDPFYGKAFANIAEAYHYNISGKKPPITWTDKGVTVVTVYY